MIANHQPTDGWTPQPETRTDFGIKIQEWLSYYCTSTDACRHSRLRVKQQRAPISSLLTNDYHHFEHEPRQHQHSFVHPDRQQNQNAHSDAQWTEHQHEHKRYDESSILGQWRPRGGHTIHYERDQTHEHVTKDHDDAQDPHKRVQGTTTRPNLNPHLGSTFLCTNWRPTQWAMITLGRG